MSQTPAYDPTSGLPVYDPVTGKPTYTCVGAGGDCSLADETAQCTVLTLSFSGASGDWLLIQDSGTIVAPTTGQSSWQGSGTPDLSGALSGYDILCEPNNPYTGTGGLAWYIICDSNENPSTAQRNPRFYAVYKANFRSNLIGPTGPATLVSTVPNSNLGDPAMGVPSGTPATLTITRSGCP